jgi:hypothetical protein
MELAGLWEGHGLTFPNLSWQGHKRKEPYRPKLQAVVGARRSPSLRACARPTAHVRHPPAMQRRPSEDSSRDPRARDYRYHDGHLLPRATRHGRWTSRGNGLRRGFLTGCARSPPARRLGTNSLAGSCRKFRSAPGRIRTCGRRIRSPLLCPLSYGRIRLIYAEFSPPGSSRKPRWQQ